MTKHRNPTSGRKQEEKKQAEDVFVEKVLESMSWAKKNSQVLIVVGVVIILLFSGGMYYRNWKAAQTQRAVAQLELVQQAVAFGEREEAKASLNQYLAAFEGTPYAMEARLLLGQVLLEEDDPEGAIDALSPVVREMNSEPIGLQAAFLMASAYEEADQLDEAERLFMRIANTAQMTFQIREALAGAARIRTRLGDFSGAMELYEEVLGAMEETDQERSYWEMRLEEVSAKTG